MSVINKALSELEKRNNNTAYGKYVQPESNGKNKVRIALIATLSVLTVAVIGAAVYRFGGFYGGRAWCGSSRCPTRIDKVGFPRPSAHRFSVILSFASPS